MDEGVIMWNALVPACGVVDAILPTTALFEVPVPRVVLGEKEAAVVTKAPVTSAGLI